MSQAPERAGEAALFAAVEEARVRYDILAVALEQVVSAGRAGGDVAQAVAEANRAADRFPTDVEQRVRARLEADPDVKQDYEDPVSRMLYHASEADDAWTRRGGNPVAAAGRAEAALKRARHQAERLVLPGRATSLLQQATVGRTVAIADLYDARAPSDEERDQAVKILMAHRRDVPGLVDAERRVIYKTASGAGQKLLVCGIPLLAWLGGLVALWVVGHLDEWLSIDIAQLNSTRRLLEVYALVTIGTLLHFVVAVRKARVSDTANAVFVPAEALDWIHIKALSLTPLLVPVLVTTVVVRMTKLTIQGTEDWAVAILAGYSSDSVAQLGWDRLNKAVDTFAATLETTKASS